MSLSAKGFGLKRPLVQLLQGVGVVGQLWAGSRERAERGERKERTEVERRRGPRDYRRVSGRGLRAEYGEKINNQLGYTKAKHYACPL